MSGKTVNYANCVGAADYYYETTDKSAYASFMVNSVAINNEVPLNLFFDHEFFSQYLTKEENDKFINDLVTVLKSINAQNITAVVRQNTPVAQTILASYNIDNVDQSKVDELTTTIATVCDKAIEDISGCSN